MHGAKVKIKVEYLWDLRFLGQLIFLSKCWCLCVKLHGNTSGVTTVFICSLTKSKMRVYRNVVWIWTRRRTQTGSSITNQLVVCSCPSNN